MWGTGLGHPGRCPALLYFWNPLPTRIRLDLHRLRCGEPYGEGYVSIVPVS